MKGESTTDSIDQRLLWGAALLFLIFEVASLMVFTRFSVRLAIVAFLALGVLVLILRKPFNGVLVFLAIEYSGIVWGLEIPNGFITIVALVTVAWILERFIMLNWTFRLSPIFFWILGFYIAALISGLWAFKLETVLAQSFYYVELTFLLFLLLQFLDTPQRLELAVNAIIFAVLFSIVVGMLAMVVDIPLLGHVEQGFRFRGLSGDPNIIATQILVVLPILVFRFFAKKEWPGKLWLLGLILVNGFGLIATFSRSAILGLGLVVIGLLYMLRKNRKLLFGVLMLVVIGLILMPDLVWERLHSLQDLSQDPSLRWRARLYALAFEKFLEHPITGMGLGNFLYFSHAVTTEHLSVHSTFLEIAAETGILGLFFYSGMIFYTIVSLTKARKRFAETGNQRLLLLSQSFIISLIGLLGVSQFISLERFVSLWMLLALSISLVELSYDEGKVS